MANNSNFNNGYNYQRVSTTINGTDFYLDAKYRIIKCVCNTKTVIE